MTKLMTKAIAEIRKLPVKEQEVFAGLILEELESEQRWDERFARHPEALAKLAKEARADRRVGRTKPLKFPKR